MHRFLVSSEAIAGETPTLGGEVRRHLKVVRPKDGEKVELFDGAGKVRHYEVVINGRDFTFRAVDEVEHHVRPETGFKLFACITKGSRWDWTIEKATELGVTEIVPVISERTIVRIAAEERAAKRERWQRIAEDAARQSDAVYLPKIHAATPFDEAVAMAAKTECFIGALTTPPSPMLGEAIGKSKATSADYGVFIGPEGDFTPEELARLMKVATPASFGTTILRAETAAIYALSVIKSKLDSKGMK